MFQNEEWFRWERRVHSERRDIPSFWFYIYSNYQFLILQFRFYQFSILQFLFYQFSNSTIFVLTSFVSPIFVLTSFWFSNFVLYVFLRILLILLMDNHIMKLRLKVFLLNKYYINLKIIIMVKLFCNQS